VRIALPALIGLIGLIGLMGCDEASPEQGKASTADVIEVVGHGAEIDWTSLELEVIAQASGSGAQSVEAAEQLARRSVEAAFQQAVLTVHVTSEARVADLVADPELGAAVRSRVSRWVVERATYGTSGSVELVATLSLQELLRPWALQIARPVAAPLRLASMPPTGEEPTGLVIDARGTDLRPTYTLRLVAGDGRVLYAGELWEEQAVRIPPFRFVPDGAHPAVAEAGERPLLMVAEAGSGSDLVLSPGDVEALGERERDVLLGRTTVIVVVDGAR
jgi:hypothetical protein